MRKLLGSVSAAMATLCLLACSGTYQHRGRCFIYEELPDGTKRWMSCNEQDTWHFETKSWKDILNNKDKMCRQNTDHYYYRTDLVLGGAVTQSWYSDNYNEFAAQLPDMATAMGVDYNNKELDDAAAALKNAWVEPDADYKKFHP